jgi:predicted site-specific integrase-resolvase
VTQNLLTTEQVCDILGLKPVTVKRYAKEGLLDSIPDNGKLLFEEEKVNKFKALQAKLR